MLVFGALVLTVLLAAPGCSSDDPSNPAHYQGGEVLQSILVDGRRMSPRETFSGKEYATTGRIVLGDLLSTAEPDQVSAVSNYPENSRPRRETDVTEHGVSASIRAGLGRQLAWDLVARC
jgi:hypothetical protein